MYSNILVAIENSAADRAVLAHVERLARLTARGCCSCTSPTAGRRGTSTSSKLRESEEMRGDREYLEQLCDEHGAARVRDARTAGDGRSGDRAGQGRGRGVGRSHRHVHARPSFLNDLLRGSTADRVRHNVAIPVLMVARP